MNRIGRLQTTVQRLGILLILVTSHDSFRFRARIVVPKQKVPQMLDRTTKHPNQTRGLGDWARGIDVAIRMKA